MAIHVKKAELYNDINISNGTGSETEDSSAIPYYLQVATSQQYSRSARGDTETDIEPAPKGKSVTGQGGGQNGVGAAQRQGAQQQK